jgi:hypothetical protein
LTSRFQASHAINRHFIAKSNQAVLTSPCCIDFRKGAAQHPEALQKQGKCSALTGMSVRKTLKKSPFPRRQESRTLIFLGFAFGKNDFSESIRASSAVQIKPVLSLAGEPAMAHVSMLIQPK